MGHQLKMQKKKFLWIGRKEREKNKQRFIFSFILLTRNSGKGEPHKMNSNHTTVVQKYLWSLERLEKSHTTLMSDDPLPYHKWFKVLISPQLTKMQYQTTTLPRFVVNYDSKWDYTIFLITTLSRVVQKPRYFAYNLNRNLNWTHRKCTT